MRVLISFAHESPAHDRAVRSLWALLRQCGIDARVDFSAAEQPQDWKQWMREQVRDADFVLCITSPAYRRRSEGTEEPGEGLGVQWEAAFISEEFYRDRVAARQRFLPVLLPGGSTDDIPDFFGPASGTHYQVSSFDRSGIERLLRVLTDQPLEVEPPLGQVPMLPPAGAAAPPAPSPPTAITPGPPPATAPDASAPCSG
jgi:hypothetical protein